MLKGIDPLLSPQLLSILSTMGHRQELAIVDANYPVSLGSSHIVRLDGIPITSALKAITTVFPLDVAESGWAWRMTAKGEPEPALPIFAELRAVVESSERDPRELSVLPSSEFKERVQLAYAIVVTGERRRYGNVLLRKGVVE